MDKIIILGVVLVLGLVVAGFGLYWLYERPVQEAAEIRYHNLSIRASNTDTGRPIVANWTILTAGQTLTGHTLKDGFVLQQIPVNQTVQVYMHAGGYYTAVMTPEFDFSVPTPVRVEPALIPVGYVTLTPGGRLGIENPLPVTITAHGHVHALKACVRWSTNLISVSIASPEAVLTTKEPRLRNRVDKCYSLNLTMGDGESHTLLIDYREYLPVTAGDSITIHILYGDNDPARGGEIVFSTTDEKPFLRDDTVVSIGKG